MNAYEVPEPILNSPFEEPALYWHIEEGQTPEKRTGRRPAIYSEQTTMSQVRPLFCFVFFHSWSRLRLGTVNSGLLQIAWT